MPETKPKKKASLWKSIRTGLYALLAMVVIAFGFQVTQVNLEQLSSKTRQESLVRVMRALAKPDFLAFNTEDQTVNAPIHLPCPESGSLPEATPPASGPYLVITPACGSKGDVLKVEGFNFTPNSYGPLRFIPGSDPDNIVMLGKESVKTDSTGYFIASLELPNRPSPDVQYIRAALSHNVGWPHFTQSAKDTWNKIVETVFLALLATIAGTLLAIPISFFAARNLMKPVKSPLVGIVLSLLGWIIGIGLGVLVMRQIGRVSALTPVKLWVNLLMIVISLVLIWLGIRWAIPQEEVTKPRTSLKVARLVVLFACALIGFYALFQLATLATTLGTALIKPLKAFGFLGNFLYQSGRIVEVLIPVLGALIAGGALSSFLGRLGQKMSEKLPTGTLKVIRLVLSIITGATLFGLVGYFIQVLYEIGNPLWTLYIPMAAGALLGGLLAVFTKAKYALSIGLVIYYITRTILNTLRSVEALVMAIVFVIAVGIGPFAGVLALGLHTIVSLAKLYSEQVESILSGPLEAVEATGANRLQTIIYAVIPQIIPPYISYTMYRWDINVRMSTIIGFVGGGGIGFLLQQNINLLNYQGASAQMVAIAVVVATMDYISSVMREKTV